MFQAFNWLLRSVSQLTCLHDLLWFFVTSLTPPPVEAEEEEAANDEGKKEQRKEPEQVRDDDCVNLCLHLSLCQLPSKFQAMQQLLLESQTLQRKLAPVFN